MVDLEEWLRRSERVPGWTRGAEAEELARLSYAAPDDAVLVEVGSFLGSGAILLAGPRTLKGSGRLHCVDRLDGGGDAVSVPHYDHILAQAGDRDVRRLFERNMAEAGLQDWVELHGGDAAEVARGWRRPIHLLFLDGDQTAEGARSAFDAWSPFVVPGGVLALHNSHPGHQQEGHDGYARLAKALPAAAWDGRRLIDTTTFYVKT